MKQILLTLGMLASSLGAAWSQTCSVGTFMTQADIDNFRAANPGCQVISGDLNIVSTSITNLDSLQGITHVQGSVYVNHNPDLTSIAGLGALQQIDGEINIEANANLTSLHGLESFSRPMRNVRVVQNPKLISIAALSGLTTIPGFLSVGENVSLPSLTGLENLTNIDGAVSIAGNTSLSDLTGIANLSRVGYFFYLGYNAKLSNLNGLQSLTYVGERLEIAVNNSIISLQGVDKLQSAAAVIIRQNASLSDCAAQFICNQVKEGRLTVYGNKPGCSTIQEVAATCQPTDPTICSAGDLRTQADINNFPRSHPGCKVIEGDLNIISTDAANLDGLLGIETVQGSVRINNNGSLISMIGLSNIKSIGGEINIEGNTSLTALQGLDNISQIGLNLRVVNNVNLTTIEALRKVTAIPGFLSVGENISLPNLTGLHNLTSIQGAVSIAGNSKLTNLTGLDNLKEVNGSFFYIGFNAGITSLRGLEKLTSASSGLRITDNNSLINLTGLSNFLVAPISITNNSQLTDCSIKAICESLKVMAVEISNNATGCKALDEVVEKCSGSGGPDGSGKFLINSGGEDFSTNDGRLFKKDQYYGGINRIHTISNEYDIAGTDNDELYRSERSAPNFNYAIPVLNGIYNITFHFAEIYFGAPGGRPGGVGKRLFNISLEGYRVITNYDIYARAGGAMKALTQDMQVEVTDGILNIDFTTGSANLPSIAAMEIRPYFQTRAFSAEADALVRDGIYKNQNFGSDPLLGVKGSGVEDLQRASYLRFPIPGINNVRSAILRVYGSNHETTSGAWIGAGGVLDDTWNENEITKFNAPAFLNPAPEARVRVRGELKYWDLDVTEFVKLQAAGDKVVSLVLTVGPTQIKLIDLHSRENPSGFAPQLIITTDVPAATARIGGEEKVISENASVSQSIIYPNPAKDHITLEIASGHKGNVDLQLTSPAGHQFALQHALNESNASKLEVNLPAKLPAGIYLLKIQSDALTETAKVLVTE